MQEQSSNMTTKEIAKILLANANKSFVQRILNKKESPILKNPDGTHSTHSMAYGKTDEGYVVFPTVLMTKDGSLRRLSPKEAFQQTQATKNYIPFQSEKAASDFSKQYKKFWGNDPTQY